MKLKNILLSGLSLVLVAALAIGGTVAYLQDDDSDVNVMTLGNVSIEQIEQEWNAGETALQDFTQAKPLYPYVGNLGWENTTDNGGAYRRFTMNNVVDKYVSVKNAGKSDAYVRTIIALEMGDYTYDEFNMVGISINKFDGAEFKFDGAWDWTDDFVAQIDGKNYNIMVAVHKDAIEPGETTIPSLLQVYMNKDATNEDCEKIDGNGNGTYDILVFSQAVQAAGFDNAETALNAGFGDITTTNHPWVGEGNAPVVPVVVNDMQSLSAAIAAGQDVVLTEDITLEAWYQVDGKDRAEISVNSDVVVDLNGHTITGPAATVRNGRIFQVTEGNSLTIKNGKIFSNGYAIFSGGNGSEVNTVVLENVEMSTTTVGVYHNGNAYGVNVVIKDSKIVCSGSSSTAVFLSGSKAWGTKKSSLSVENSTLEGGNAIEVKYCDVSVKNSTLTATATPALRVGVSGGCAEGYALALTNNGNDEDSFGIVTIENTTITGPIGIKAKGEVRMLTEAEYTETAKIIKK